MSIKSAEYIEQPTGAETHGKSPAMSRPFSLGDWYIVPELNRLKSKSDKEERQLEPRLIKLLCYLAANEDRVLTRDELVQELWPRVIGRSPSYVNSYRLEILALATISRPFLNEATGLSLE